MNIINVIILCCCNKHIKKQSVTPINELFEHEQTILTIPTDKRKVVPEHAIRIVVDNENKLYLICKTTSHDTGIETECSSKKDNFILNVSY